MDIINTHAAQETTDLCYIMYFFGSDKGHPMNQGHHNFTRFYYNLFKNVRQMPLRVFELGMGTNNVNIPSNMGANGKPGASLRGWKQFFPNAKIFGADIDRDILFQEDRISTYYCDQNSAIATRELWGNPSLIEDDMDIIIEDGYHDFTYNVNFFEYSNHKLKVGGVFIIEDIMNNTIELWHHKIAEWEDKYKHLRFRIYDISHEYNPYDNILILAQRLY